MQCKSFHWLSHHGIWVIIPCSTNIVSVRVILGAFLFLFYFSFVYFFRGVFNETIVSRALVKYEMVKVNEARYLISNMCSGNND